MKSGLIGAWKVLGGAPFQMLLASGYDWNGAVEQACEEAGGFDASIVLLWRLDPCVRSLLPDGLRVLDAVVSLRRSMTERSRASSWLTRWFWREEARRMGRIEDAISRAYHRVLVVSEEDARQLDAVAVSNGVSIAPLVDAPRAFDFGFWGRLAYFANLDAASWLLDEIWPAIRVLRPDATLLVGGADVPARILAAQGRDGITVQSPIADVAGMARQVRVALFPVRYGTGQSNKVLEAAEAGCAVVATTKAMRGLEDLTRIALIADDTRGLARAAVAAVDDESQRRLMGSALRHRVERDYARRSTLERLAAIIHQREAAA
jgi:glycosyltransferase involved in cell wall biosynthesis